MASASPKPPGKFLDSLTTKEEVLSIVSSTHADIINAGLSSSIDPGLYLALDCEMVGIGPDPDKVSALARISIVNVKGAQVYDSYVLPTEPVTDYRTSTSGITAKLLRKARPFDVVQQEVADLIADRLIVGHDIRHDLAALGLPHPKKDVRDTCRYPPYRELVSGSTPGLRMLSQKVLGVKIQSGPHSSLEDARATMALFWREKEEFEEWLVNRWRQTNGHGKANRGRGLQGRYDAVRTTDPLALDVGSTDNASQIEVDGKVNKYRKKKKRKY